MAEWIEIFDNSILVTVISSPLAMAEWIEIYRICLCFQPFGVSASDGGVD